jgi:hypothetical protein
MKENIFNIGDLVRYRINSSGHSYGWDGNELGVICEIFQDWCRIFWIHNQRIDNDPMRFLEKV